MRDIVMFGSFVSRRNGEYHNIRNPTSLVSRKQKRGDGQVNFGSLTKRAGPRQHDTGEPRSPGQQ